MTIEDESGFANLVIFQNLFETYRKAILQSRLIMVEGKLQRVGEVIHVIVSSCHDYTRLLRDLTPALKENIPLNTPARGDEKSAPPGQYKKSAAGNPAQARIFPDARNFK